MKTLFLLLLSCVSCLAQFGVAEQPMFASAAGAGGPFTPDQIPNLLVWINPTTNTVFTNRDFTGVVISGQPCRSISNSVVTGPNLTNNTVVNGNTWFSTHNGNTNPCIYINWNQGQGFRTPAYSASASEQWTFSVIRPDLSGFEGVYHYFWCSGGGILQGMNNGSSGVLVFDPIVGTSIERSGPGDAIWQLITWKQKTDDLVIRTNGVLRDTISASWSFTGYDSFALLADFNSSVFYRGDVAELIHYNGSLTSNQVWQVENYLRRHPFVYSGP